MKRYLILLFAVCLSLPALAQRYRNPSQYYRQFANENRKIDRKNLIFLTAVVKGEEKRRTDKYQEMVLDQLRDSKKEVDRIGPYEEYDILQREYSQGLENYIKVYQVGFDSAAYFYKNRYANYDTLQAYHKYMAKAEGKMFDAAYKLRASEDHFAKRYYVEPNRDPEIEDAFRRLDEVILYTRDMDLAFFKVNQEVQNWLDAIAAEKRDTLHQLVTQLRRAIRSAQEDIASYEDFEGEDDLYKMVKDYLAEINEEVDENFRPLSDAFANAYLDPDEYRDAERALERVQRWHEQVRADYLDTRADVIEDYFPE